MTYVARGVGGSGPNACRMHELHVTPDYSHGNGMAKAKVADSAPCLLPTLRLGLQQIASMWTRSRVRGS